MGDCTTRLCANRPDGDEAVQGGGVSAARFSICLLVFMLAGCCTGQRAMVSGGGLGTGPVTGDIGKLGAEQAGSAEISGQIAGDVGNLTEQVYGLEFVLAAGAGDDAEFTEIIRRIRLRPAIAILGNNERKLESEDPP